MPPTNTSTLLAVGLALTLWNAGVWAHQGHDHGAEAAANSDKAVTTDGFKGTAIFVIEGKPQRISLTPAGENRLSGTASVTIPATPKRAVQITTPSGSTMQAEF